MKLGDKIHDLRAKRGLTQGQLANSASLSQGYLSQLENGEVKNPSAAVLYRLARAIRVNADELFEAAGYPTAQSLRETYQLYESNIDPDLLQYVRRLTRERQRRLLRLLQGMESLRLETVGQRGRQLSGVDAPRFGNRGFQSREVYLSRGG